MAEKHRKHWLKLGWQVARLMMRQEKSTADLVQTSYNMHAATYDQAWTNHMRDLSMEMLDSLDPAGQNAVDYTCGTGFVTDQLAQRMNCDVTGVDASEGMLEVARESRSDKCSFVHSDILEHLKSLPPNSLDVITCAWGLGYSKPWAVVSQIARVLRPGGKVGIIDNTLFSLAGVMRASISAFAETPEKLQHVMNVRFLPHSSVLGTYIRLNGLCLKKRFDGKRVYHVPDGQAAIARLEQTGAAAGFEFAAGEQNHDQVFNRFAEIIEKQRTDQGIPITHRYLGVIAEKRK